jgi:hypothetical protein
MDLSGLFAHKQRGKDHHKEAFEEDETKDELSPY